MIRLLYIYFLIFGVVGLTGCSDNTGDVSPVKTSTVEPPPLSSARLLIDETDVKPGGEVTGRFVITLAEDWHTYSDPPGDSGMAPIINFTLPDGWTAAISPLPEPDRFEDEAGVTLGYEHELSVGFRLKVSDKAISGSTAEIKLTIQYLICKDICLPQSADLRAVLKIK